MSLHPPHPPLVLQIDVTQSQEMDLSSCIERLKVETHGLAKVIRNTRKEFREKKKMHYNVKTRFVANDVLMDYQESFSFYHVNT